MRGRLWVGMIICILAGTLSTAWAQPISCGATLGPGGVFVLQADLLCATPIGLTVRDGARLDLGGHLVGARTTAVLLEGRGAVLEHGRAAADPVAVQLAGAGGHMVRGIETFFGPNNIGFEVLSDDNRLLDNVGSGFVLGFWVEGDRNRLVRNTGGGQSGFYVLGQQNVLLGNVSVPGLISFAFGIAGHQNRLLSNEVITAEQGFYVWGDGNRLTGNVVRQSFRGILVSGQSNVIARNTALENRIDLMDMHQDCDGNRWADNVFQTVDPACTQGVPARQASR
jgi:parallel beta-helix repeat protein